ncbi:hypothetical protein V1508DRAFT_463926 [Lipomyces doorenjongii]|uniref:uncharacterized protein n=1 Tax=Lipomyces doorenjongii TaxID=383834 RepID=UPI0034CEA233
MPQNHSSSLGRTWPWCTTSSSGLEQHVPASSQTRERRCAGFLNYCQAWYWFVVGHHDSEEAVLFPAIEKATGVKGIMDEDVKEHAAFHHGLAEMKSYIEARLATPSKYNGDEFVKTFDSFAEAFHSHLTNEPLKLVSLASYNFDMKAIGDATTQHALQRYSTTRVLPILWYNLDTKYEGGIWEDFHWCQLRSNGVWSMLWAGGGAIGGALAAVVQVWWSERSCTVCERSTDVSGYVMIIRVYENY